MLHEATSEPASVGLRTGGGIEVEPSMRGAGLRTQ